MLGGLFALRLLSFFSSSLRLFFPQKTENIPGSLEPVCSWLTESRRFQGLLQSPARDETGSFVDSYAWSARGSAIVLEGLRLDEEFVVEPSEEAPGTCCEYCLQTLKFLQGLSP